MNRQGPIVIIEDDEDDQYLLNKTFEELAYPNEIIYFEDGEKALEYLSTSHVELFIIISDVSMPRLSGSELREKIHNNEDLRLKCIPHVFFSTTDEQTRIVHAYSKSIQGFFIKPDSTSGLKETIRKIVDYWSECVSPDYVK